MPTYALLGATGGTGSSVLRCLLDNPPADLELNILVRSKLRLLQTVPQLTNPDPSRLKPEQIHIFEGDATSPGALIPCLTNASIIFKCVGQNAGAPGTTLHFDSTSALLAALATLRNDRDPATATSTSAYHPPTVLQLRSASLNPSLAAQVPLLVHKLVTFCLHHSYTDLRRACRLYESAAAGDGLLRHVFVDPPTIHDPLGTQRTGYKLVPTSSSSRPATTERQAPALSYADLGAAMCEIAERVEEFAGTAVGVGATGKVTTGWAVLGGNLARAGAERVREGVAGLGRSPLLLSMGLVLLVGYLLTRNLGLYPQ